MGEFDAGDFAGWPQLLARLVEGNSLSFDEAGAAMTEVFNGRATGAQLGALLALLRAKGETAAELAGFAAAMRDASRRVPLSEELRLSAIDTCGTGGDRSHSINVSTAASFVAAAAGVPVCKHGNRAATSSAGAADVLEALGVVIDLEPERVGECIETIGIGFCMAPVFHPAMRFAGPTRKELGIPTSFNFLGPLANPGGVVRQVIGVSDIRMAGLVFDALVANGAEHAMVVHGGDGLDELTTTTTSQIFELRAGEKHTFDIDPLTFGLPAATLDELRGGDAAFNAARLRAILAGEHHPQADIVALNAAAALVVGGKADGIHDGLALAQTILGEGAAGAKLDEFIAKTQSLAG